MSESLTADHSVPLDPKRFGYEAWNNEALTHLQNRVGEMNGHLVRTLGAVAAIHKPMWPAPDKYLRTFDKIGVSVKRVGNGAQLVLNGLPSDCFQDTFEGRRMPARGERFLTMVLADAVRSDWSVGERMSQAGLRDGNGANYRTFIQGGHTVPDSEYDFSKELGFALGTWFSGNVELMTGCGPRAMEGPFKGLVQAYIACNVPVQRRIGLTEMGILAKEAPNGALSNLVTFPNIEERMEGFIRAAQFGSAVRGGAGTMEELLVFAGVMNHKDNKEQPYPFYLFEPNDRQNYFGDILNFIEATAGSDVSKLFTWQAGTPQECVRKIVLPPELKEKCAPGHWNDSLVVPEGFLKPFEATRDDFEALVLSRDRETPDLLCDLRRLFSGLVTVTVKNSSLFEEYSKDRPRVRVEPQIQSQMEAILQLMQKAKRIPSLRTKENGTLDLPFEFVNP